MILQPLITWWILIIIFSPIVGLCIWLIIAEKSNRKTWLRRLVVVVLILLAFLRPSLPGAPKNTGNALLDVFAVN